MMVIMMDVMTVAIEVMIIVMINTVAITGNAGNTNSSVKDWNWNVAKIFSSVTGNRNGVGK